MPVLKNPKHEIFAQEIASGKSATEAMVAAGYSEKTSATNSHRLTKNDAIATRIDELQAQIAQRSTWDAAKLLIRLGDQADADILDIQDLETGRFKPLDQWPVIWRKMIQGVDIEEKFERSKDGGNASWDKSGQIVKIKFIDRLKNLELLGKHKAVAAFVEDRQADDNKAPVTICAEVVNIAQVLTPQELRQLRERATNRQVGGDAVDSRHDRAGAPVPAGT